ncbi:DUF4239 domain-containing protein [Spirosoma sp. HMF4905]|uniref:DUF4239 domain-containing protein n=1 Tax=Spirosoma arboris TaxID=2682092 RepID=A0A7K1SPL7_9BACT|nr:DUF4239 domain-containing protein [Spirosoma arboris]MVM35670.1 DUF4239 domain-containing protein [Spirosoma arboris]
MDKTNVGIALNYSVYALVVRLTYLVPGVADRGYFPGYHPGRTGVYSPTPAPKRLANSIDNGTVGWFFSAVSLLYGLLLGLLTVAAWGNYNQAAIIASQEASATAVLYRDLAAYPDTARDAMRKQVHNYLTVVVDVSWPAQRQGLLPDSETVVLNQFQKLLLRQTGLTNEQLVVHSETIRAYNNLIDLRRQRQEALKGGVPGVLWLVVLLGAMATTGFSYCFVVTSYRLHALLTGVLAGMIGLIVFLLVVLDHSY